MMYFINLSVTPSACLCYPAGSRSEVCDRVSGQCKCRHEDITGRRCDNCTMDGYYGPVKGRCRECKCIPANTMECHKVSSYCSEISCDNDLCVTEDWRV